jgi:hypothetical protein
MGSQRSPEVSWHRVTLRILFLLYTEEMTKVLETRRSAGNQLTNPDPEPSRPQLGKRGNDPEDGPRDWLNQDAIMQLEDLPRATTRPFPNTPRGCGHQNWTARRNQFVSWFTCLQCGLRKRRNPMQSWNGE